MAQEKQLSAKKVWRVGIPIALLVLLGATTQLVGQDKVSFPDYTKHILYGRLDEKFDAAHPDYVQHYVVELYASPEAAKAARQGKRRLPSGSILTQVWYEAKVDAGKPLRDADGRYLKADAPHHFTVMEKRSGWGR